MLSRNPKAHKRFHLAFEQGRVVKRYLAVLDGVPDGEAGVIDLPLSKISSEATGWRMRGDPRKGKPARTHWQLIRAGEGRALLSFTPETGRTHQIRIHAAEGLGIPIMGDPVYGAGGPAMMLHAERLAMPRDGKPDIDVTAPLPERFALAGFGVVETGDA